jgi:hypothetical protein
MAMGTDSYGPLALPEGSRVVVESDWHSILARQPRRKNILTFEEYSVSGDESNRAYGNIVLPPDAANAIRFMEKPERQALELIWDTVWWRRIAYFSTMLVSFFLLVSPVYSLLGEYPTNLAGAFGIYITDTTHDNVVVPIARFLAESITYFVPNIFSVWITAFRSEPFNFLILSIMLVACLLWGTLIDRRINDRSTAIWNSSWSAQRLQWFKESLAWRSRSTLGVSIACIILVLWLVYLEKYTTRYCHEWFCFELERAPVSRYVLGLFLLGASVVSILGYVGNLRIGRQSTNLTSEPRGLLLEIANRLRNWHPLSYSFEFVSSRMVPAVFAIAVIVVTIASVNRVAFTAFNVSGAICKPDEYATRTYDRVTVVKFDNGCFATGIHLDQRSRYQIYRLDDLAELNRQAMARINETDLKQRQFEEANKLTPQKTVLQLISELPPNSELPTASRPLNVVAAPFVRRLGSKLFEPIVRIGNTGNEEYTLEELAHVHSFTPKNGGYLYLYLNNVVVGWPTVYDLFYRKRGSMLIRIENVEEIERNVESNEEDR